MITVLHLVQGEVAAPLVLVNSCKMKRREVVVVVAVVRGMVREFMCICYVVCISYYISLHTILTIQHSLSLSNYQQTWMLNLHHPLNHSLLLHHHLLHLHNYLLQLNDEHN